MTSTPAYTAHEYEALIAPCLKPVEVLDRRLGRIFELFASNAFSRAAEAPEYVPVVFQHRGKPIKVGNLTGIQAGPRWISCKFRIHDTLPGLHAAERLDVGSPVSIEYHPVQTHHRLGQYGLHDRFDWHFDAILDALAVCVTGPAFKGARITAIRSIPAPPRRKPASRNGRPKTLIRDFGEILDVR